MKRKQLIPAVLAGTLIGAALVGPASAEVAALTAAPSTQTFYVDGKQVDLEAYVINGTTMYSSGMSPGDGLRRNV